MELPKSAARDVTGQLREARAAEAAEDSGRASERSSPDGLELRVVDNPDEHRYEALLGDELVGVAEYRLVGDRVIFIHTETDPELAGRGIASRLARGALDDVRARGRSMTPKCPFIAAYVRRHPAYQDLVVTAEDLRHRREHHG